MQSFAYFRAGGIKSRLWLLARHSGKDGGDIYSPIYKVHEVLSTSVMQALTPLVHYLIDDQYGHPATTKG